MTNQFKDVCFFDSETTGLVPKGADYKTDYNEFPHIVQLGWILNGIEKEYIIKPDGWVIPDEAAAIHGITTEIALAKGVPFEGVIKEFIADCKASKVIVGFNIYFDTSILKANILRFGDMEFYNNDVDPALDKYKRVDVMRKVIKFVDAPKADGKKGAKFPKLTELYAKIFGTEYAGAHGALADVRALVACMPKLLEENLIILKPTEPKATEQRLQFSDPNPVTKPIGTEVGGTPFDNADRSRYYGIRVGDIVDAKDVRGVVLERCEVVQYGAMDNNRVYLKGEKTGKTFDWVAEWCEIIQKVEDKPKAEKPKGVKYKTVNPGLLDDSMDDF